MRIETALNQSRKLLKFANELNESENLIYSPTRTNISEIINNCSEVINLMSHKLNIQPEAINVKNENFSSAKPSLYKTAIDKYAHVLRFMASQQYEIDAVRDCLKFLWDWFNTRILLNKTYANSEFKTSPVRFRKIIYSLVINYGYHYENNVMDMFATEFDNWKSEVGISEYVTSKCATDALTYKIEKNTAPEYANLTAVILWDLLIDCGLDELCDSDLLASTSLSKNGVWNKTESLNPDVLNNYSDYKTNPDILKKLGLQ